MIAFKPAQNGDVTFANDLSNLFGFETFFGGEQHHLGAGSISWRFRLMVKFFQLNELFFCQGWHL